MKTSLRELLSFSNGIPAGGQIDDIDQTVCSGISTDSRTISAGTVFLALSGDNFDGHDFVEAALKKGAVAAIVKRGFSSDSRFAGTGTLIEVDDTLAALQIISREWRRKFRIPLLALTGSNGKTTTKTILGSIVARKYPVVYTEGNLNNHIGVPLTLNRLSESVSAAIIEMGANHFGEIETLSSIALPGAGLITNIGKAHTEAFGDRKGVFRTKTELFRWLSRRAGESIAIYPATEDMFEDFFTETEIQSSSIRQVSFGFSEKADYRIVDYDIDVSQALGGSGRIFSVFTLKMNNGCEEKFETRLIGRHNIENISAAIAAAVEVFGVDITLAREGISRFESVSGRSDLKILQGGIWLMDDCYNANPSSFRALLETLSILKNKTGKKVILVSGDMAELGDISTDEHRKLGKSAIEAGVDHIYTTGGFSEFVMQGAKAAGGKSAFTIKDLEPLYDAVCRKISGISDNVILAIKGSRCNQLDQIVDMIERNL